MNIANRAGEAATNESVLRALDVADEAMDAYQVAKAAGLTPVQAGRTLAKLAAKGVVRTTDPLGTDNDLSARYRLIRTGV